MQPENRPSQPGADDTQQGQGDQRWGDTVRLSAKDKTDIVVDSTREAKPLIETIAKEMRGWRL